MFGIIIDIFKTQEFKRELTLVRNRIKHHEHVAQLHWEQRLKAENELYKLRIAHNALDRQNASTVAKLGVLSRKLKKIEGYTNVEISGTNTVVPNFLSPRAHVTQDQD